MSSGGARNRSGPPVDPTSGRSDARGVVLTALPSQGYEGDIPSFPLPAALERETELWESLWRTPQAAAWAAAPWRHYVVGQYVRWAVKAEAEDASAANVAAVLRFADQIGLTPAGLKENGWAIATDELAARAAERTTTESARPRRLRDASSGGA